MAYQQNFTVRVVHEYPQYVHVHEVMWCVMYMVLVSSLTYHSCTYIQYALWLVEVPCLPHTQAANINLWGRAPPRLNCIGPGG